MRVYPSPTLDKIMAALKEIGPMTTQEIADFIGIHFKAAEASIRYARTKKRPLYVKGWHRNYGTKGKPTAIYAAGDKPDAKKPVSDTRADNARYRERNRLRIRLADAASRGKTINHWVRILSTGPVMCE